MIRRVTFADDLIMIRKRSKGKELEEGGGGGRGGRLKGSLGRGVPQGLSNEDPD